MKRERLKTAVEWADGCRDETREHVARCRIYEARDLVRAEFVINVRRKDASRLVRRNRVSD